MSAKESEKQFVIASLNNMGTFREGSFIFHGDLMLINTLTAVGYYAL